MANGYIVFDYHGYSHWPRYLERYKRKARQQFEAWDGMVKRLPVEVLISEEQSKRFDGLWLREPEQFLHNAMPRARKYLQKFQPPSAPGVKSINSKSPVWPSPREFDNPGAIGC
ncbi:MAG: hypothetical protein AAF434_06025 [Pseudomonadota bacterium]